MRKRTGLIAALLGIVLLVAVLMPLAENMTAMQRQSGEKDADHMIKPMLEMLENSPQMKAKVAVEPMMDLEAAWEIEDTRAECTEGFLVTGMRQGDNELGFDAKSNTFYCTLGIDNGSEWPELELLAQPAEETQNLRVAWIDDYNYDDCTDAVSEGYRYELIAYTDTEYAYFGLVFTGLPLVTLHVDGGKDALDAEYIAARMSVSSTAHEAIDSGAWVHLRGGGYLKEYKKWSYRVEFHEVTERGDKKVNRSVLGMPADTDWLLLGNGGDETCSRNELAWGIWRDWNEGKDAFMTLQSRMVELFVEDEYVGIYQLIQRIDPEKEIVKMGGSLNTDCAARVIKAPNLGEKPDADWMETAGFYGELRYAPPGMTPEKAFKIFDPYIAMSVPERKNLSKEEFTQLCEATVDIRSMLEYFQFVQAASLGYDNYYNNVYMWALWNGENYVYYLSPWDMDQAFERMLGNGDNDTVNMNYALAKSMIDLNVGNARDIFWELWNERRGSIISDDAMYNRIQEFEDMINQSGAYLRETEKWYGEARKLDLESVQAFAVEHLHVADDMFGQYWPSDHAAYAQ